MNDYLVTWFFERLELDRSCHVRDHLRIGAKGKDDACELEAPP
jgi:hypothetical protein